MRLGLFAPRSGDPTRLPAYLAAAATTTDRAGFQPEQDVAALRAYAAAGVDQVVYLLRATDPDGGRAEIETLARELLPVARTLTPAGRG
jgi:hypothetical protein